MKNLTQTNLKPNRKLPVLLAGAVAVAAGAQNASAALSTEVGTAFTTMQTDALALVDLAWPVVGAIVVAFITIKLFKRAASKV